MNAISVFLVLLSLVVGAFAAGPDASGKWKWDFERNGEVTEIVMNLKQEDGKLTGKIQGPEGREFDVREGKIVGDGKVAFNIKVARDDGTDFQIDFAGRLSGDTITGKTEYTNRDGEKREREWVAKRDKKIDVVGNWKSEFRRADGTLMESRLKLKQEGEKLSGTQTFNNGNEAELQDAKLQGDEISFRVVRERDGRTFTSKYRGKIDGETIKGEIETDRSGEIRKREWTAKKEKN